MQRIVSINLNGNVYQLEENGYTALFAYLDAVHREDGSLDLGATEIGRAHV